MSEIKKEAATLEEIYVEGLSNLEDYKNDTDLTEDRKSSLAALVEKLQRKPTFETKLYDDGILTKAQIRALKRYGPPDELDADKQKDMILFVKALGCLYYAILSAQGRSDQALAQAISDLISSIKKKDKADQVFLNVRRHLIEAVKEGGDETPIYNLISRAMRGVGGTLNSDRDVIYASRAIYILLSQVKTASVREIAAVLDQMRVSELRDLVGKSTLTELLSVSLVKHSDIRANAIRKSINTLASSFGSVAKTAEESAEVRGLVEALRKNRESAKSASEVLREQNRLIEEAQNEGELNASIVEVIKVLNEAQVLVVDSKHQSEIGAELGLTSEQEKAMLSDGRTIISAGAGSGKTRVLSGKVAHLIKSKQADPYSIIACSFSRKSASDLKKKIEEVVGKSLKNIEYTTIGRTTHSIAIEFINRFDPSAGNQKIVDERKLSGFVKKAIDLVKDTNSSGQRPKKETFWSDKVTPEKTESKREDLRILSMIYTLESWREDNGYERTGIPGFIKGLRSQYLEQGAESLGDDDIKRVNNILDTRRGSKILNRAFGGNQEKVLEYTFPSTKKRSKKSSEDSMWWGHIGSGNQGEKVKFPSVKKCQLFITKCKARMLSPSEAFLRVADKGDDFELKAKVYGAYQHLLNIEERMDFDDVLIRATRLLSYKTNLDEVRKQYKHIIVDEAQDLNPVQHAFFGMIAGTYSAKTSSSKPVPVEDPQEDQERSFTLIGDENQSIYGFRGATSQEFTSKSKTNEGGSFDLMSIGINFRSGENIVNAANRLASQGLGLSCIANIKSGKDAITHEIKKDTNTAARDFANMVKENTTSDFRDDSLSDYGMAFRTNAEMIPYALALLEQNIDFRCGVNPFHHPSTRAIVRVMGSATEDMKMRRDSLYNSWKDFGYDFPPNFDQALQEYAELKKEEGLEGVEGIPTFVIDAITKDNNNQPWFDFLETAEVESGDTELSDQIYKYFEIIRNWGYQGNKNPSKAFDMALGHIPIYEDEGGFRCTGPSGETLAEILTKKVKGSERDYLLPMTSNEEELDDPDRSEADLSESDQDPYAPLPALRSLFNRSSNVQEALTTLSKMETKADKRSVSQDEDVVVLDTVHGWKGLEVTNLYVPMVAGKFPSEKVEFDPIVHNTMEDAEKEKAEQEQKLAYVAVTRGMKNVTVLSYKHNEKGEELQPSEYISRMGLNCGSKTASTKLATALEILSESLIIEDDDMSDAEIDEALGIY